VSGTTFTDNTVQAGVTYFYVVTAVDATGTESVNSNEVSVTIPTP
jgi:fibronectin type 3 domain-containing protein